MLLNNNNNKVEKTGILSLEPGILRHLSEGLYVLRVLGGQVRHIYFPTNYEVKMSPTPLKGSSPVEDFVFYFYVCVFLGRK